jgi:hypothetical protein
MVKENRADYPSEWAAFIAISNLFDMSPETLRRLGFERPRSMPVLASESHPMSELGSRNSHVRIRICVERMPY